MTEERSKKNQVFTQDPESPQPPPQAPRPPGVDPAIPTTTAAAAVKAEFGLDIPVEMAPLPSCGRVYPKDSPLHGLEELDITPMTAREEDILTSEGLLKKGTVITELIKSCLVNKYVDPGHMLIGDRNALMVSIRITGYGADYEAETQCSSCSVTTPKAFDLAGLELRRLTIEPVSEGMNLFEFALPYTKKRVRFRFLTGDDETEIMATTAKQKKLGLRSDTMVTTNLLYSIVSIEGIEDRGKIARFVKMMPARDSMALRMYMRDHEPGIIMKQEVTCDACGEAEEVAMPMGVKFLWPAAG